jgi:dolichol-phosphate mannosyltransferase
MTDIAVVIAAYNEVGNIAQLTERLISTLDAIPEAVWRLIYVIEGVDGTLDVANTFADRRSEINILYQPAPSGLGTAFRRGFDAIPRDTEYVVTMDADLNHQPEEIPLLLQRLLHERADIVVGSRRLRNSSVQGTPFWKQTLSYLGNGLIHLTTGVRINDLTSGFRIYRARALGQIRFENVGFAFLPEILIQAAGRNMKIVEEPIRFVSRVSGESKMRISATLRSYCRLFFSRFWSFSGTR